MIRKGQLCMQWQIHSWTWNAWSQGLVKFLSPSCFNGLEGLQILYSYLAILGHNVWRWSLFIYSYLCLVTQVLENTCSSKESSLKDLQELAARVITKGKSIPGQSENAHPEVDSRKKQPNKELNSNANLSPLARFLLSRFVTVIYKCLLITGFKTQICIIL